MELSVSVHTSLIHYVHTIWLLRIKNGRIFMLNCGGHIGIA